MICYDFNGKRHYMTFDEMYGSGKTHDFKEYAFGERPIYPHSWQRMIYHRHLDMTATQLVDIVGKALNDVHAFKRAEGLPATSLHKVSVIPWSSQEDDKLLELGTTRASCVLDRSYNACKSRMVRLRNMSIETWHKRRTRGLKLVDPANNSGKVLDGE